MQAKTERFEMRLDRDLLRKVDAWRTHQTDIPSRAEAVRRLIDTGVSEMEEKPIRFSDGERLITSMLCELFKHLDIHGTNHKTIDPSFIEDVLEGGHYWALRRRYPGIFHQDEDNEARVRDVVDVLEVWSFLEQSHARLSQAEKNRVENETEFSAEDIVFSGFDGNNETEDLCIAGFLIDQLGWFEHFKDRDLNSHCPMMAGYQRMVHAFKPMRADLRRGAWLTKDQIIALLQAQDSGD